MNKKLAIRGHSTRGKEVIELLEMLGGNNSLSDTGLRLNGTEYCCVYYIGTAGSIIYSHHSIINDDFIVFTLEEFWEKYPFKVGDKVVYTKFGENCNDFPEIIESMKWTGTTIEYTFNDCVTCLAKDLKMWNKVSTNEDILFDSIIWHLRNSVNNGKQYLSGGECEKYFREVVKKNNENKMKNVLAELLEHIKNTSKEELEKEFNELEEWSNVGPTVEEFMTFCECVNKKPKYPDNYEECVRIAKNIHGYYINIDAPAYRGLMESFVKLLICRDAYWKIAGEEMRLDKPWKPDWENGQKKFCIISCEDRVTRGIYSFSNTILAFPTEEMRDVFYENFKDLIEQCKELL